MSPIIPSSGLHALLWSFLLTYRLYFVDVVQLLSCIWLFMTPWTCQAPLSFTISWNLLGFMSIELVTLSNHLFLCCPFLLLPSIFSSIRVFSNELALCIRWPKYWSFSISSSNEYSRLILLGFRQDSLQSKGLSRVFPNSTVQKHQFFSSEVSTCSSFGYETKATYRSHDVGCKHFFFFLVGIPVFITDWESWSNFVLSLIGCITPSPSRILAGFQLRKLYPTSQLPT